ncbi:M23 family metallopeptidase [Streptomyces sp. NPDC102406]|uniref:M23 family metallopeptidase n=1 Tax=Streptomyces sp. NPDC102406 TaxID=3366171 RepID=UPI0038174291
MRPRPCRSSVVTVLLCAFFTLLALTGPCAPAQGGEGPEPSTKAEEPEASTRVARLFEKASAATQRYEAGRRAAHVQEARARRTERLLARERRGITLLHNDLGRIARAQYRSGGDLPLTARMLLSTDPEELVHGQRAAWQADLALDNAVSRSRRAERKLAEGQREATAQWHSLRERTVRLAQLKKRIERRLAQAQGELQGAADRSVTAGQCRGAVRLDQPGFHAPRAWVPPVESYELSAGFDEAGGRWSHRHTGQDFAVDIGTPVRAAGGGRVVKVSCGGGFGIEVVVRHPGGYCTQYAHLAAVTVDQGEKVRAGQWLGQSGTTGNSTGPHLHFEVRLTPYWGSGVDPVQWFAERGVRL